MQPSVGPKGEYHIAGERAIRSWAFGEEDEFYITFRFVAMSEDDVNNGRAD